MILAYLKEYVVWYSLYALMYLLFLLNFILYHLPMAYFLNSLALNLVVLAIVSAWRYYHFRQKYLAVTYFQESTDLEELDSPSDLLYRKALLAVETKASQQLSEMNSKEQKLKNIIKMWSHQMKIPIAAISLMVQTNTISSQDLRQQLIRLEHYLDNLLNYIKFNQHQDDFRFEMVSLRQCSVEVVKKYRVLCLAKQISVTIDGDSWVKTDKKWLSFALSQLLDNSIKYSPNNSQITITIRDKRITISDNGIGILEEDIPRLFDEGFTGYNGHEDKKATGLGLYMTKQVLDSLHFTIHVDSQVNKGTQITISHH
ncbi:sensor histidine kinase [Streptococcus sp. zg-JUN1979]|uniref:sensor histidine kinase n=1 Tax=Streptococcus sp. zg-JUN1979 TaxID=3391450 RepID=UPI0039A50B50